MGAGMSRLEYYQRPLVAFDAANSEHRQYFYDFLTRSAWGRCPVRFICPDEHGPEGLPGVLSKQLLDFYMKEEFGSVAEKPQNLVELAQLAVDTDTD